MLIIEYFKSTENLNIQTKFKLMNVLIFLIFLYIYLFSCDPILYIALSSVFHPILNVNICHIIPNFS